MNGGLDTGDHRDRNTGYKFDLLDREKAGRDPDTGLLEDALAHMGNYDSRHEAIGMAAILGRRFGYDYEVRSFESMWREAEEPTVCQWCGHEEHHRPLVGWTLAPGGPFCSTHCYARHEHQEEANV